MNYSELFSRRYHLRPTSEGFMYDDVPKTARIGLFHIITHFVQMDDYRHNYLRLYRGICETLRIQWNWNANMEFLAAQALESLIMNCEWWQFYDICQFIWQFLNYEYEYSDEKEKFAEDLNHLLRDELLGYEMREGKIEKIGSGFIDAKVKEARYLLKEPEFKGADKHFEKAIKALNVRPNPEVENCIKDAVAAIESVGRIIVHDEKALLSDIIKDMSKKGIIPKPLDEAIQKIYAYRGDQPGIAHGLVGTSKVTVDEAEFVLAMSAAAIIYLVKKRSAF